MKKCSKCNEYKGLNEFHNRFSAPDGKQAYCKPCKAVADRARHLEIKQMVQDGKNCPCTECGIQRESNLMHYHHVDPTTKKFNVSSREGYTHSKRAIIAEMAKCVVVCQPCHNRIHYGTK